MVFPKGSIKSWKRKTDSMEAKNGCILADLSGESVHTSNQLVIASLC